MKASARLAILTYLGAATYAKMESQNLISLLG
jgi:hypothetical protein